MAGVYISYPFCNQKCSFCNFSSGVSARKDIDAYHLKLLAQLNVCPWPWQPETLYFGGGTPSLMPLETLASIMAAVPANSLREVTMEAAPGSLTPGKVKAWRVAGVNRVSLGVQSFVDRELRQTGRSHDAETVASDVRLLRSAGITNFNIDLIAGLPDQTPESWSESLNWLERLQPPHVSVYIFEVDEDSRLGKEMLLGGVRYGAGIMPADDLLAQFYEDALARLEAMGIHRYEISNFARTGFASRHNLKYWRLEPYLGFGLDAHSYVDGCRFSTTEDLTQYLECPTATSHKFQTDSSEEHFFVGLRLDSGIQPTREEWSRFAAPIQKWTKAGMLIQDQPWLRLSKSAALISNEIFEDFLNLEPEHV